MVKCDMTKLTSEQQKQFALRWKTVGPELERIRFEELSNQPFRATLVAFNGLFEMAIKNSPPLDTSGLVEFQRLLAKAHVDARFNRRC
jgi:hypothetical protein